MTTATDSEGVTPDGDGGWSATIERGGRGIHESVVNELGTMIVGGRLAPNETLPPEDELSQRFGVSHTVIREAMRVLVAKGLVDRRPRVGTRVNERERWSLLDPTVLSWQKGAGPTRLLLDEFTEVREVLEPEAARRAAERASTEQIADLVAAYEGMADAFKLADYQPSIDADIAFHRAVFAACGNQVLRQTGNAVILLLEVRHSRFDWIPGQPPTTLPLHERVVQEISARHAAGAARAMTALVKQAATESGYVGLP